MLLFTAAANTCCLRRKKMFQEIIQECGCPVKTLAISPHLCHDNISAHKLSWKSRQTPAAPSPKNTKEIIMYAFFTLIAGACQSAMASLNGMLTDHVGMFGMSLMVHAIGGAS